MDWHTRLVYIGLWSYVDDNGVGRDVERLILADLFPLDEDLTEASLRVHGALKHLNAHGQITRYRVKNRPYLHITAWEKHQRVNRPSGSRYPLPTCDDAENAEPISEPSVSPHESLSAGEGEKGRRGEGNTPAPTTSSRMPDRFPEFWSHYPKKKDRGHANKAWRTAVKKVDPQEIIDGLIGQLPVLTACDPQFIPYGATWLNGERWADEAHVTRTGMTFDAPTPDQLRYADE